MPNKFYCQNCNAQIHTVTANAGEPCICPECGEALRITTTQKPPLGVMPRKLRDECRLIELSRAIQNCIFDQRPINPEWIDEYNELTGRTVDKHAK